MNTLAYGCYPFSSRSLAGTQIRHVLSGCPYPFAVVQRGVSGEKRGRALLMSRLDRPVRGGHAKIYFLYCFLPRPA